MKNKILLPVFFLLGLFIFSNSIEARSGCCSHHGGVCGCGCCDGTSLFNTCAPYYPQCGGAVEYKQTPVQQAPVVVSPKPVVVYVSPSPKPSIKPSLSPSPSPVMLASPIISPSPVTEVLGEETKSSSDAVGVLGVGGIAYVIWRAIKQKWPFQSNKIN